MLLTPTLNALARRPVPINIFDRDPEEELDADMLFSANDAPDETWSSLFFDDADPDDIECNDLHTYSIVEQDVDITSDFGTRNPELQTSDGFAPQQGCPYITPPSSQGSLGQSQNESKLKPVSLQAQRISTADVLQVVVAGLKYATSKSPARKVKSATVSSNEGFKSLSSVAPALWVPDYHRSVSSRAVLIPTISHAIANVSSRASTNLGLSAKVRQLARQQSRNVNSEGSSNAHLRARELQDPLSVKIWQEVTSVLSSTAVARKLQPFSDVAEPNEHADAYESMEDMLDENATDQESCRSCDDSDFEDLDDTLSEFNDEVAGEIDYLSELGSTHSAWIDDLKDCLVDHWDSGDFSLGNIESDMLGEDFEPRNWEEEVL
jgi:hypothetical protein